MEKIKAWFEEYKVEVSAIFEVIINFIKDIFAKEVPEADDLLK